VQSCLYIHVLSSELLGQEAVVPTAFSQLPSSFSPTSRASGFLRRLLCGFPSLSELLQSDRIGFAVVVDQSCLTAGGCVPPHDWLQAAADWLHSRSDGPQPEESSVRGSGCLLDARLYDAVLQQLPKSHA
jgi:hypothetical protein